MTRIEIHSGGVGLEMFKRDSDDVGKEWVFTTSWFYLFDSEAEALKDALDQFKAVRRGCFQINWECYIASK